MKQILKRRDLPLVCLALGGLGLVLKKGLYALGMDALGLLTPWHLMGIGLMLVTAAALALIVTQASCCPENTAPVGRKTALMGGVGCFFSAAGIFLTVTLIPPLTSGYPAAAWQIFGFAAGVSQLMVGYSRLTGRKSLFFLHLLVSLFFVFHIIDHYRTWSSNPQMLDFLFSLLGMVTLALFAFYCAAGEVGLGRSRMGLGMGLAALYFGVVELADTDFFLLFFSSIVWVYTTLQLPSPQKGEEAHDAA